MCKTALQGQTDSIVNALKIGILVMLLPAVAIVTAILLALKQSSERGGWSRRTTPAPRVSPEIG